MKEKMTIFQDGKQHNVYVTFDGRTRQLQDVQLPGDLMSIMDKLTPKQLKSIRRRIDVRVK